MLFNAFPYQASMECAFFLYCTVCSEQLCCKVPEPLHFLFCSQLEWVLDDLNRDHERSLGKLLQLCH